MTDICGLLTDEDAVSPIIGVILMVAVTVILSAAVGAFVLDIGSAVTEQRPQAKIGFNGTFSNGSTDSLTVSHDGGETLQTERLTVTVDGTVAWRAGSFPSGEFSHGGSNWTDEVETGDELVIKEAVSNNLDPGMEVQLIWKRGQRSSVLAAKTL